MTPGPSTHRPVRSVEPRNRHHRAKIRLWRFAIGVSVRSCFAVLRPHLLSRHFFHTRSRYLGPRWRWLGRRLPHFVEHLAYRLPVIARAFTTHEHQKEKPVRIVPERAFAFSRRDSLSHTASSVSETLQPTAPRAAHAKVRAHSELPPYNEKARLELPNRAFY